MTDIAVPMAQNAFEFSRFLSLVRGEDVRSYLEIGVRHGGSLRGVASAINGHARIVGVDLPGAGWGVPEAQTAGAVSAVIRECEARGQSVEMMLADSHSPDTVEWVRERAPFDLLFIDGDHTEAGVRHDWESYGPMARMVAFHDIDSRRGHKPSCKRVGVWRLWEELIATHEHVAIVGQPGGFGIGVIWRH